MLLILSIGMQFVYSASVGLLPIYMQDIVRPDWLTPELASGLSITATAITAALAMPFLGRWTDRRGPHGLLIASLVGSGLVLIFQALIPSVGVFLALRGVLGVLTLPAVLLLTALTVTMALIGRPPVGPEVESFFARIGWLGSQIVPLLLLTVGLSGDAVRERSAGHAFAAGLRPQSSYVGVTTGLLRVMPKRELEAVLAHEVSHIRNRDTYLMTMATVFAGVIALVADLGFRTLAYGGRSRKAGALVAVLALVGLLLAPYAALLLRMSLSRRREFLADAGAAEVLNDPEAMALALRRLELDTTTIRYAEATTAHLWVESPTERVGSEGSGILEFSSWFNTHPPMRSRIAALEEVAGSVRCPVLAIGGITPERVADVSRAGAAGVGIISAIVAADRPADATKAFLDALGRA